MEKTHKRIIGAVLAVVGIVLVAYSFGWINFNFASTVAGSNFGISVETNTRIFQNPLSTVTTGNTFKWAVTIRNTGSVAWNTGWVNTRLGINGATVVDTNCQLTPASCPSGTVIGNFKVEKCSYGTDVTSCREDISSKWNFQYSTDGGSTWKTTSCTNSVCSVDVGNVAPGASMSFQFRLTVPSTVTTGNFPLITQAMAWNGATYAIAGTSDPLTVGTVSGEITLELIGGIILAIAGIALAVLG